MSKKFKLVYEDSGIIKGSYSGIPAKSDEALIERAVLEGTKPVPPAPAPGPFNPTELLRKAVTFDFGKAEKISFLGYEYYAFNNIDPEIFLKLVDLATTAVEAGESIPSFRFSFEGKEYIIISYAIESETTIGELVNIDITDTSAAEHHNFEEIGYVMDAETGDGFVALFPKE